MSDSGDNDGLDDFLDMLEDGLDVEMDKEPPKTPPQKKKPLNELTYEDVFGSPEKESPERKKPKKEEGKEPLGRSKVESCGNSVMSQLGSRPVQPSFVKNSSFASSSSSFDTSNLIIDHHSRIRIFKTSVALFVDEGGSAEAALRERNFGLQYVSLLNFPFWFRTKGKEIKNFWTSGILVRKQPGVRKSAKGNEYVLWEVNDLKQLEKSWTIFLFSSAVNAPSLSAIPVGSLIDITTPSVLESTNNNGVPSMKFSINNSTQIRLVGTAKDFGFCQSTRKDGKPCTAVVNTWECCTCVHHAASELKKLNSSKGQGQKRERKQGVSFARGTLFDAPPMSNPKKEGVHIVNFAPPRLYKAGGNGVGSNASMAKASPVNLPPKGFARMELQGSGVHDQVKRNALSIGNASSISFKTDNNQRLHSLGGGPLLSAKSNKTPVLDLNPERTRHLTDRDREILAALNAASNAKEKEPSAGTKPKNKAKDESQLQQCSTELASRIASNPTSGSLNFMKYLTTNEKKEDDNVHSVKRKESEMVTMSRETLNNMQKALALVRTKGPIVKKDPNAVGRRKSLPASSSTSRISKALNSSTIHAGKKAKHIEVEFDFGSEEFKKILNAKSAHDEHTTEVANAEYFDKLVKKEAIENKLLNTYTIATNAVMCKQCKYVALSQSDYCKQLQHQIRVVKATKRFFKCKDCGNRTMSLDRLPKHACKQCSSPCWLPAPVGKEKTGPLLPTETLSLRGHEEKFVGTASSKMYLNLEVE